MDGPVPGLGTAWAAGGDGNARGLLSVLNAGGSAGAAGLFAGERALSKRPVLFASHPVATLQNISRNE